MLYTCIYTPLHLWSKQSFPDRFSFYKLALWNRFSQPIKPINLIFKNGHSTNHSFHHGNMNECMKVISNTIMCSNLSLGLHVSMLKWYGWGTLYISMQQLATNLTDGAHGPHVAFIAWAILGWGQQRFGVEEGFGVQGVQASIDWNLTHRTQVTVAPDLQLGGVLRRNSDRRDNRDGELYISFSARLL